MGVLAVLGTVTITIMVDAVFSTKKGGKTLLVGRNFSKISLVATINDFNQAMVLALD